MKHLMNIVITFAVTRFWTLQCRNLRTTWTSKERTKIIRYRSNRSWTTSYMITIRYFLCKKYTIIAKRKAWKQKSLYYFDWKEKREKKSFKPTLTNFFFIVTMEEKIESNVAERLKFYETPCILRSHRIDFAAGKR